MAQEIIIATRKSRLALWQANFVGRLLVSANLGFSYQLLLIETAADQHLNPLQDQGGKGLFVKAIQQAVLDKKADIAVHSAKDMPCKTPKELCLAAVPKRGAVEDVLVAKSKLDDLPDNAVIATSSPRRKEQLLRLRPNLNIVPIRGNVLTRLEQLQKNKLDGLVLALAGLERLSMVDHIAQVFLPEKILPAAGQGCLAVECLSSRPELIKALKSIDHAPSHAALAAERACLMHLGGHCFAPIAAYATAVDGVLFLRALVGGKGFVTAFAKDQLSNADILGENVAKQLIELGAEQLLSKY